MIRRNGIKNCAQQQHLPFEWLKHELYLQINSSLWTHICAVSSFWLLVLAMVPYFLKLIPTPAKSNRKKELIIVYEQYRCRFDSFWTCEFQYFQIWNRSFQVVLLSPYFLIMNMSFGCCFYALASGSMAFTLSNCGPPQMECAQWRLVPIFILFLTYFHCDRVMFNCSALYCTLLLIYKFLIKNFFGVFLHNFSSLTVTATYHPHSLRSTSGKTAREITNPPLLLSRLLYRSP